MAFKRITDFTRVGSLNDDSIFLIEQASSTGTVYLSTLSGKFTNNFIVKPATVNNGQVLYYTNNVWSVSTIPTNYIPNPASKSDGQALVYNNNTWSASTIPTNYITNPTATKTTGDYLRWDGDSWEPQTFPTIPTNYIPNPSTKTTDDYLKYDGTDWVATTFPSVLKISDFTGSNQSIGTNGWQKLPGGLILQWGTFTATGAGSWQNPQIVSLPISFPNAIWYASVSEDHGDSASVEFSGMDFKTSGKTTTSQIGVYTNYTGIVKFFAIGN
jgi:hypothetical protein